MASRITKKENPTLPQPAKLPQRTESLQLQRRPAFGEVGNKLANRNPPVGKPILGKPLPHPTRKENLVPSRAPEPKKPEPAVVKQAKPKEEAYSSKRLLEVEDPDARDKNECLLPEYIKDIYSYLRELEGSQPIRGHFLSEHRSTPRMRSVLVNWMVEVHLSFKLLLETLHLSVSIVDRYLQHDTSVGRDTLQLVGVSALLVASKYEEIYAPELGDFEYVCDYTFSKKEILKMEKLICSKLDWNLGRPLSLHFLRRFNKVACVQPEHHMLGKYLLELGLLEYELSHIRPSMQAAAATCLSISILNEYSNPEKAWTDALAVFGAYKYADFKNVLYILAYVLLLTESSKYQAVHKKYAGANYGKISTNPKLRGTLVKCLAGKVKLNMDAKGQTGLKKWSVD